MVEAWERRVNSGRLRHFSVRATMPSIWIGHLSRAREREQPSCSLSLSRILVCARSRRSLDASPTAMFIGCKHGKALIEVGPSPIQRISTDK